MTATRKLLSGAEWRQMALLATPPLLALWADTREVYALLHDAGAPHLVSTPVEDGGYPALSPMRPFAARFEQLVHDLWGHVAVGGRDARPWLNHGHWPHTVPMGLRPGPPMRAEAPEFLLDERLDHVPFGPVRGGIAPAAHLRFGVHGDTVVQAELRLGYTHKGTLTLMRGKSARTAARFAARLAGEATVAHSIAFARATEAALACEAPPRAGALRGVMAELERLTCHLDTIAATAEAAGFAAVANRCALHGEALRRAALIAFGHRLLMDCVVPGGVVADITPGGGEGIARAVTALAAELPELARASWTGRLAGIGAVSAAMAAPLPGGGVVGRAGDAATRTEARLAELGESARLLRNRLAALPDGAVAATLPVESGEGVGLADGPAGDVWHWLRLDHGQIASVFMRDPAWVHWHLLEAVMTGCSLDDLPVVLASFGLSSSAVDL